jgi:hypothetical protein
VHVTAGYGCPIEDHVGHRCSPGKVAETARPA